MQDEQGPNDDLTEIGFAAALLIAAAATAMAVLFRITVGPRVSGEQAIFSYPAIIIVTLLAGRRAGAITAGICLLLLWHFVIPHKHSFGIATPADAVALLVYAFVGIAFVLFLGRLRILYYRHRKLSFDLEKRVHELTAQRARMWESVPELAVVVVGNGTIEAANPSFAAFVGLASLELHDRHLREFFLTEGYKAFRKAQRALSTNGGCSTFSTAMLPAGEGKLISWSLARDGEWFYLVGR